MVVMPGTSVFVGDTDDEAREIEHEIQTGDRDFDRALAGLGRPFGWHDFRQYDLDAPFPQQALAHAERGFRTNAEKIANKAKEKGWTLRQTVEFISSPRPTLFAGSPDRRKRWPPGFRSGSRAAPSMASTTPSGTPASGGASARRSVPILQERGIVRTEYEATTLRGDLDLPVLGARTGEGQGAERGRGGHSSQDMARAYRGPPEANTWPTERWWP